MINQLAHHKLLKLRHSRMLLILGIIVLFLGLLTLFPIVMMHLAGAGGPAGEQAAIMYFSLVALVGHIIALMLGVTTWRQDLKDGTLLAFAARPISRMQLLAGKILGSVYTLLIYLGVTVVLYAAIHLIFFNFTLQGASWLYPIQMLLRWLTIYAVALFFSGLSGSLMAAALTLVYFMLTSLADVFLGISADWAKIIGSILKAIAIETGMTYSLEQLLTGDLDTLVPLLKGCAYYAIWSVVLLSASSLWFIKREINVKS